MVNIIQKVNRDSIACCFMVHNTNVNTKRNRRESLSSTLTKRQYLLYSSGFTLPRLYILNPGKYKHIQVIFMVQRFPMELLMLILVTSKRCTDKVENVLIYFECMVSPRRRSLFIKIISKGNFKSYKDNSYMGSRT